MSLFSFTKFSDRRSTFFAVLAVLVVVTCVIQVRAQETDDASARAVATFNQGQEAHEKGDLKAALDLYAKAIEIVPEFPEAELQRGNALLSLRRADEAEKAFRRALDLRPEWTLAMATLGSLLVDSGESAEAEKLLTRALELDGQNFLAYSALADLRLSTKAAPETLRGLLDKISPLTSGANAPALIWAAKAGLESALGNARAARLSAERALVADPSNRRAVDVLFDSAITENDASRAAALLAKYEKINPGSPHISLMRARLLVAQGKPVEALALLNSVESPLADVVALRDAIAAKTAPGSAELEKLLETEPRNADALADLCRMFRAENPAKALEYCRRASEVEPANAAHAVGYAAALVQAKRFDDAVTLLRRIVLIAPDNNAVHANLATAYFQLARYADAKSEYLWLTKRQPRNAAAYYFLAITHDHLGEFLDAMANYQQFLKIADASKNGLEIEKVKLRIPSLEKQIKDGRGKKNDAGR